MVIFFKEDLNKTNVFCSSVKYNLYTGISRYNFILNVFLFSASSDLIITLVQIAV